MGFPQITEAQMKTLQGMCGAADSFSQVVPDEKLDGPDYKNYMEGVCDTNQLVILGLVKEITDSCSDNLAKAYEMTRRLFRVFQITEIGKAMFSKEITTIN